MKIEKNLCSKRRNKVGDKMENKKNHEKRI